MTSISAQDDKLTNGEAIDIIENEGLGYAVQYYISGDKFKDPMTTAYWNAASTALTVLSEYLEHETGRELD